MNNMGRGQALGINGMRFDYLELIVFKHIFKSKAVSRPVKMKNTKD